jgi:hypothetical protein
MTAPPGFHAGQLRGFPNGHSGSARPTISISLRYFLVKWCGNEPCGLRREVNYASSCGWHPWSVCFRFLAPAWLWHWPWCLSFDAVRLSARKELARRVCCTAEPEPGEIKLRNPTVAGWLSSKMKSPAGCRSVRPSLRAPTTVARFATQANQEQSCGGRSRLRIGADLIGSSRRSSELF